MRLLSTYRGLLFLCAILGSFVFCEAQSRSEVRSPKSFYREAQVLSAETFKPATLLALSKEELGKHSEMFAQILFSTSQEYSNNLTIGKGQFHYSFDEAVKHARQLPILPVAALFKIGRCAELRLRDASGLTTYRLAGWKPFDECAVARGFRVEYLAISRGGEKESAHLFLVGPVITEKQAASITRKVRKGTSVNVAVHFRTDPWFLDDPYYPWRNPFVAATEIPFNTEQDYETSFRLDCFRQCKVSRLSTFSPEGGAGAQLTHNTADPQSLR